MARYPALIMLQFCTFLLCCWPAGAQQAGSHLSIDTLLNRIPVLMRSNEAAAVPLIRQLRQQATENNNSHALVKTLFFESWLSYRHDPVAVTIQKIDSVLAYMPTVLKDSSLADFYILRGQCYVKKSRFGQAIGDFKTALKIAESKNDVDTKVGIMISIGWAYMEDGKPREAIRFFNEILRLRPSDDYPNRDIVLCNIASCYNTLGNFKLAEVFARRGIASARSHGNPAGIANGLNILGRSYYEQGRVTQAIEVLKEAGVERLKLNDPAMLASDYLELAGLYMKIQQPAVAIQWAEKAAGISKENAIDLKLGAAYETLAAAWKMAGEPERQAEYLQKLLQHKDSVTDERYKETVAEMEVQFKTQQKANENLELKKANLEANLKSSNQQRWLLGLGATILLLAASGIYFSKILKSRYRERMAVAALDLQKKQAIAVMEAEEQERKRIAADLHDGVCQTLAAASLQLQLHQGVPQQQSLQKVDNLINAANREARGLSHQLTPELLLSNGIEQTLADAVEQLDEITPGIHFRFYAHVEQPLQHNPASLVLYRCFQELTNNIIKHSNATEVVVQLNLFEEEIQLLVEDNGEGFNPANSKKGLGLRNIESRVAMYNGTLSVDSTLGKGASFIIAFRRANLFDHQQKSNSNHG